MSARFSTCINSTNISGMRFTGLDKLVRQKAQREVFARESDLVSACPVCREQLVLVSVF